MHPLWNDQLHIAFNLGVVYKASTKPVEKHWRQKFQKSRPLQIISTDFTYYTDEMDAREARQYVMNNPPSDPILMERRPSLLGRLFRRTSSTSEDTKLSSSPPDNSPIRRDSISQVITTMPTPQRRESITEIVKSQMPSESKPGRTTVQEFGIFT